MTKQAVRKEVEGIVGIETEIDLIRKGLAIMKSTIDKKTKDFLIRAVDIQRERFAAQPIVETWKP